MSTKIEELVSEVDERRPAPGAVVFSVSETHGIVPQSQIFKKTIATDDRSKYRRIQYGDIIFNPYLLWNRAVGVCFDRRGGCVSPAYIVLRPRTPGTERFLHYFFRSKTMTTAVDAIATGSVTRRRTAPVSEILNLTFNLPDLEHQKTANFLLTTLDDKIEVSRKMNVTLERIARTLFKSWFVDFDPIRAKMEGRDPSLPKLLADLFPARFVDSELGKIPEGWEVSPLGDVCERITDGSHASPASVETGRPMASVKDMRDWGFELSGCRRISEQDYQELVCNNCRPLARDVLIAKDGSYLKHIFVVESDLDLVVLSSIAILRPNARIDPHFLAFSLRSDETMIRMARYVSGAVLQRIVLKDFRRFAILIPPKHMQQAWARIVGPLIHRCWRNADESKALFNLRETLLPKLIFGELRIKDAERVAGVSV
jgi:type I restriction enzyme S subunit